MTLTCWSCRHSMDSGVSLAPTCALVGKLVFEVCDALEYEPGTDECEREQQTASNE